MSNGGNVSGATNATLTLANVSDSDVATYSVIVSDLAGSVTSSNATLTVIDPPVVTSQPVSETNWATTTATFAVSATGTTPFTYQWYFGTNVLTNGGNISGATNSSLTVSNVLAVNAGQYLVSIANPAATVTSSNAALVVIDPWITNQPVSVTNYLGGCILQCYRFGHHSVKLSMAAKQRRRPGRNRVHLLIAEASRTAMPAVIRSL